MLYRADHQPLPLDQIADRLACSAHVREAAFATDSSTTIRLEFIFGDQPVVAYSMDSDDALFIDVCSDEALRAMLEIRRAYDGRLRLCDTAFTFDVELTPSMTFDNIVQRMAGGEFDT
jgi:hypothetical protein